MEDLQALGDRRAVLIAGPTASGKSALALQIASRRNGVVINADSMQVYRELRILSARPGEAETRAVPHRLYGHVAASVRYSVARWREDAKLVLEAVWGEGRLPVIVGGTGLYFKALTEGLAAVPIVPAEIRANVEARAAGEGAAALHAALTKLDPDGAALLQPNDRTRLVRALEVIEATGRPLRLWQADTIEPPLLDASEADRIVLDPPRALLYQRIDQRFDQMVGQGALEEVAALLALGLDPALPAMKAIGVREFSAALSGALALEAAVATAKMETRRYAKRQVTWFRNQMSDWPRAESIEEAMSIL